MCIVDYLSTRMGQYVLPTISTSQLDNVLSTFLRPFGMQIVSFDHIQADVGVSNGWLIPPNLPGHHKDGEIFPSLET